MTDVKTFAEKINAYNDSLEFPDFPVKGIRTMNPFREYPESREATRTFYDKYYNDSHPRYLIIGINPGRFGAGVTGIPFTDPKRLTEKCGIPYKGKMVHEPSSVFVYDMIDAYGGPEAFYKKFFFHSVFPLGFVSVDERGRELNYNYYDSKELIAVCMPFILQHIRSLIAMGVRTDICYCLGTGKNYQLFSRLNEQHHFFKMVIPLEHPRFIVQYKSKHREEYIKKYLETFGKG